MEEIVPAGPVTTMNFESPMPEISPPAEISLKKLVHEAGSDLLRRWPGRFPDRKNENLVVSTKPDGSLVTDADHSSSALFARGLPEIFPGTAVWSEEMAEDPDLQKQEKVWIIDPLDGTQTFIQGNDDFSILAALSVHHRIEYGVMYFPARKVMASAQRGFGAFLDGVPLAVSGSRVLRERSVNLRHLKLSHPCVRPRWINCGMAFFALCRGELDGIIIRIARHGEWDLAAPSILVQESGGKVTDERGEEIRFNQGAIPYRYFVASNGFVHDQLLDLIRELPPEPS